MYSATVQCPGTASAYVLQAILEGLTEANCAWYLDQVKRGHKPPCCSKCAGVRYRAAGVAQDHDFAGCDRMIAEPRRGYPCRSVAAFDAGVARAKSMLRGATMQHARNQNYVLVKEKAPGRFAALAVLAGQVKDPTKSLPPA